MKQFARLFEQIDQTQSTNEKIQFMVDYFQKAPSSDAAWALYFLSGKRMKRLIGSSKLVQWCLDELNMPHWLFQESYAFVGDTAETITLLFSNHNEKFRHDLSLADWMEKRILPLREASNEKQRELITHWWRGSSRMERFLINKILIGSFRVGVDQSLALRALEKALKVPRSLLAQRLLGEWVPSEDFFNRLKEKDQTEIHLTPYPFYLASPLDQSLQSLGDPQHWLPEWKWDGIRAQFIYSGEGQYLIWSRGNEPVTLQFPELGELISHFPFPLILDGEILAYKENRPLPFQSLQKRLGRKTTSKSVMESIPIIFMAYDFLNNNGEDLRQFDLRTRRKHLIELMNSMPSTAPIKLSEEIAFESWEELKSKREIVRSLGTEGIMLKKWDSHYEVGRKRGAWWKFKIDPMTIDAVLLYAQPGSGRRANLYTDYTFAIWENEHLIPIAKAYSGLTEEEISKLDRWIRKNTVDKFGPVRQVKPEQVFEIAFEGIQPSNRHKSGVALRFPRISRWRMDKTADQADHLQQIKNDFL